MINEILTPLNHREIEYNAIGLSGSEIPDSPIYESDEAKKLLDWIGQTGNKVFDDDLVMDYGTDCLRLYLFFENTPKEQDAPFYESWNEGALEGMYKFLGRYRRMILTASIWNRRGGYRDLSKESMEKIQCAFENAKKKMDQCIRRANTMPNRHNIVSALMELLNVLQKELKIGEIVTGIRQHVVDAAVPKTLVQKLTHDETADSNKDRTTMQHDENEAVAQLCREFIILMAPIACNLSKILWQKIA
ncbi:MAG: hypothetical protein HDR25_07370 [Lachnospiraceae bacterium]|nr:hypothetical protein [Lachnospiraceae bacterium]